MAIEDDTSWRAPGFRQKVLAQIENALNGSGNPGMMMKNPSEMENQVYSKANSKSPVDHSSLNQATWLHSQQRETTITNPSAKRTDKPGVRLLFKVPNDN
ncbi:PREDICTED: uncharacterized protein LOC107332609 isoform X1 [Acropora digitifera]|uniref:uncharacterized protein LOC107332609 isoform X1 n=1 Tax=Acropora digitifera TaxID=70779 RepID=UPI00077A390E|nr:PREDICTED: uncharacterized protein LOC107332609 isoform X1 [Acropora digitifera]